MPSSRKRKHQELAVTADMVSTPRTAGNQARPTRSRNSKSKQPAPQSKPSRLLSPLSTTSTLTDLDGNDDDTRTPEKIHKVLPQPSPSIQGPQHRSSPTLVAPSSQLSAATSVRARSRSSLAWKPLPKNPAHDLSNVQRDVNPEMDPDLVIFPIIRPGQVGLDVEVEVKPAACSGLRTGSVKSKRKRGVESDKEDEDEEDIAEKERDKAAAFQPTRLDFRLRGENRPPLLIKHNRNWFPAYLETFHPVQTYAEHKAGAVDEWEVVAHPAVWENERRRLKAADIMYIWDDKLADCALGRIETTKDKFKCDAQTRSPSPPPPLNPGSNIPNQHPSIDPKAFSALSQTSKMRALRPYLLDIINERYPPAQDIIDAFYANPRLEVASDKRARIRYGAMSEDEAAMVLMPELERWAMRGCQPETTNPDHLNPPSGSQRYNDLSTPGRRRFMQRVLQSQAIIRLCILSTPIEKLLITADQPHNTVVEPTMLHSLAKTCLDRQASTVTEIFWEGVIEEITTARRLRREILKMPPERTTEEERRKVMLSNKKDYELSHIGDRGRVRKKQNYWEGSGKDPRMRG